MTDVDPADTGTPYRVRVVEGEDELIRNGVGKGPDPVSFLEDQDGERQMASRTLYCGRMEEPAS